MARQIALHDRDGNVRALTYVDDADYEWASQYRWGLMTNGYVSRQVWLGRTPEGKSRNEVFYLHRELLGLVKGDGLFGDHISGDRLDNRRSNLRIVSPAESAQNRVGNLNARTSKHRGVDFWSVRQVWRARCGDKHVGYFATEDEAAQAVQAARVELQPFHARD